MCLTYYTFKLIESKDKCIFLDFIICMYFLNVNHLFPNDALIVFEIILNFVEIETEIILLQEVFFHTHLAIVYMYFAWF